MDVYVGIDAATNLPMWREADFFKGGVKEPIITVWYRQWLVSNGVKLQEETQRTYRVMDISAVTTPGIPILISPAVYDTDGITVLTPAVYDYNVPDIIITPAQLHYTGWRQKLITQQMVGAKLGEDLIIGSINQTLAGLPTDIADGYIIKF